MTVADIARQCIWCIWGHASAVRYCNHAFYPLPSSPPCTPLRNEHQDDRLSPLPACLRMLSHSFRMICWIAGPQRGSRVAQFLNMTPPAASYAVVRGERIVSEKGYVL